MDMNVIRLQRIVNSDKSLEKETKELAEESDEDSMNKYDSDEENAPNDLDSDIEEENEEVNQPDCQSSKEEDENDKVYALNTYIRLIDKDNLPIFKWKEPSYSNNELISLVNSISTETNSLTHFLVQLKEKLSYDTEEHVLFYSELIVFLLKKIFCFIKINSITSETIHSFCLIDDIVVTLIQTGLNNHHRLTEGINQKISFNIIQICDYILELYFSIISVQITHQPDSFISISLAYIKMYISNKTNITYSSIFIRKYIETISELISGLKIFNLTFSMEQYKEIFSISFTLLKKTEYANIFVTLIDIICNIIEIVNDHSFENKFIENILLCFDEFLTHYDYFNEKFKYYFIHKNVIRNCKLYFGEYKCLNSESISLFTYLFVRFYSLMFTKEDFIKTFELFIFKIFEWAKPNILICLSCLMVDLLKIKYNIEFTITLVIITYLYLTLTNIITQMDIELNKRKLVIHILEYFFDDLLKEFSLMKDGLLCLGKGEKEKEDQKKNKNKKKDQSTNHKKKECDCFSCDYTKTKEKIKTYFQCQQCHCKTNLKLQLIDPEKDDNQSICGFCNMKSFFEQSGMIFDKENELKLIDTNEDLIEEYSKSKKRIICQSQQKELSNKDSKYQEKRNPPNNLFDKLIYYQDILYQNAFLYLKINLLNFIRFANKNDNKGINANIDLSVKIFLKILINDQKMKSAIYKNFTQSVLQFYTVQKQRMFNLHQDILVDDFTINYFFFYHFYINFLVVGHYKIIDIIHCEKNNWVLRYEGLKMLERFISFEGNNIIFQNFDVTVISPLLCDHSTMIRESALDLLFLFYRNGKIERGPLIYILYENINESSFVIRKRIIKAFSGLIIEEHERGEHLKTIILIFLNKLNDNSESNKIKKLIYEFFTSAFKSSDELNLNILDILLELLKENEDLSIGTNLVYDNIKNLFDNVSLTKSALTVCIDYLIENFLFNQKKNGEDILQALNLMRIISYYETDNLMIYIEYISAMIQFTDDKCEKGLINRIIQISCEIISNLFDERNKETIKIKAALVNKIENQLFFIMLNKPCFVMTSAIEVYFKMINRGLIGLDRINTLTLQNYNFLIKSAKLNEEGKYPNIPELILSKSLSMMTYIIYSIKEESHLLSLFNQIHSSLNSITDSIFNLLVHFIQNNNGSINFRAFESLGFFWIKYPSYLSQSTDTINYVIEQLSSEEDKIILLRTFHNFFSKISKIISSINQKKRSQEESTFDFGIIHLFFEQFINKFSIFLVNEPSVMIRTHAIHFIKLIIELGNVNVHSILPHIFTSLFDINAEIRYISVCLLEKILHISKEKFFSMMKDSLKFAYQFQKNFYVHQKYINSFVKERKNNKSFNHTLENIFELFNYRLSKQPNSNTIQRKFLDKFIVNFLEVTSIENSFVSSSSSYNIHEAIEQFAYYEFIAKLIGDFKYSSLEDVLYVFDKLYPSYETNYCVYKTKLKQYKEEEGTLPLDSKVIFYLLVCGVQSALLKYILMKYDALKEEDIDMIKIKGWNNYKKERNENEIPMDHDISKEKQQKKKKKKTKDSFAFITTFEFRSFKFYHFYQAFTEYYKTILNVNVKQSKKFKQTDKDFLIDQLTKLKAFNSMKVLQVRKMMKTFKKKIKKDPPDALFEMFFKNDNNSNNCYSQTNRKTIASTRNSSYTNESTNIKIRNRVVLEDADENEPSMYQKKNNHKIILEEDEEERPPIFKKKKRKEIHRSTIC